MRLKSRPDVVFLLLLIVFARLVPHPWNLTPIGATGLFAGAFLRPQVAWLAPLIPLAIGDLLVGGYDPLVMACVYLGFAGTAWIGWGWLRVRRSIPRLSGAVLSGSLWFFLVSNFGVWLSGMYPPSWAGLVECYVMGLPYFGNTLIGDALYAALFFGAFHLISRHTGEPSAA